MLYRRFVARATLAVLILCQIGEKVDGQQDGAIRRATPVNWYGKFKLPSVAIRAGLGGATEVDGLHVLAATTTEPTPRLILDTPHVRPGRPTADTELWVADLDGGHPQLLADERGVAPFQFELAPGSARVAYIAGAAGRAGVPQALRESALHVAEVGRPIREVATGGVQAPGWSPDGGTLFFLKAVEGGWQPYRSEDGGTAPPVPVCAAVFGQAGDWREPPARFSPDGRSVAGFLKDEPGAQRFRVVDLASGRTRDLPATTGQSRKISWSPDSAWIYTQVLGGIRMAVTPRDEAFRVADGRSVMLNGRLDLMAQPVAGDAIYVIAAEWLPGPDHRLLLLLEAKAGPGDRIRRVPNSQPAREARWIVRDLDWKTSTEVRGLPTRLDAGDSSRLFVTPDGRYVMGLNELCALDGPL